MSVKLHCVACERFIKDLSEVEMQKTTGKELCVDCAERIKTIFSDMDKASDDYRKKLEVLYLEAKTEYDRFMRFKEQNKSQVNTILNNIRTDVEAMVKKVIKES